MKLGGVNGTAGWYFSDCVTIADRVPIYASPIDAAFACFNL
jgi:hypothetical protein